jgi:opacity protein-like surface antigen
MGGMANAQQREALVPDENTDPNLAPTPEKVDPPPQTQALARWDRLCINLTFGFGSASLGDVHELADEYGMAYMGGKQEDSKGNLQINAEVGVSYYAPYYIFAHVGYGALYQKATAVVSGGRKYENWNLLMEVPILLGGYYPFAHRFYVYGAVGPSVHFYGHSWWDLDGKGLDDGEVPAGVGMQVMLGADVMVSEPFSIGLALKYRHHKTGVLVQKGSGAAYPTDVPKKKDYIIDFSGISLDLIMRFWVF